MQATHDLSILPAKIADRVAIDGNCWIWTGATNVRSGHGHMANRGEISYVHRLAYEHVIGPIPDGLIVHHKCHNPPCVRPDHLQAITRKQHAAEHGLAGWAKIYAARGTCSKGHPFDHHDGRQRICRVCRREYQREWARRKARVNQA